MTVLDFQCLLLQRIQRGDHHNLEIQNNTQILQRANYAFDEHNSVAKYYVLGLLH